MAVVCAAVLLNNHSMDVALFTAMVCLGKGALRAPLLCSSKHVTEGYVRSVTHRALLCHLDKRGPVLVTLSQQLMRRAGTRCERQFTRIFH